MAEEQKDAPTPPPQKPHQKFLLAAYKSALEKWPEYKPWLELLRDEWAGMKKGFVLFLFLVALPLAVVTMLTTCEGERHFRDEYYSRKIDAMSNYYSGQLAQVDKDMTGLRRDYDAMRQERDKAQEELAPWIELANSQQITNGPLSKRLDRLYDRVESFTNLLNNIALESPTFDLYLNNTRATNGATISLVKSRRIDIAILNTSEISAEQLGMDFLSPGALGQANLISDGWLSGPPDSELVNSYQLESNTNANHLRWRATDSCPSHSLYYVASLEVTTNYPYHAALVNFRVYAARSKSQEYFVTLLFNP
jgi:hypothetical protein